MQPHRFPSLAVLASALGPALVTAQGSTYEVRCTGTFYTESGDYPGIDVGDSYECRYVVEEDTTAVSDGMTLRLSVFSTDLLVQGEPFAIAPATAGSFVYYPPEYGVKAQFRLGGATISQPTVTNQPLLSLSKSVGPLALPVGIEDIIVFEGYFSSTFQITAGGPDGIFADATVSISPFSGSDTPPVASAGADFAVNEGQASVTLDGSGSSDADGDPLTYAWSQVGPSTVLLSGAGTAQPTFAAPSVALGGEVLTFELAVTANGTTSTDQVNVTVVNVNHPPVADAGPDLSIAEGSPVVLDGSDSFDFDNDSFSYLWTQVAGPTTVFLDGVGSPVASFTAPFFASGGAPGVVATYEFQLAVTDGMTADAPAPGFAFEDVMDTVIVEITNLNNAPIANAGLDQTLAESSLVTLDGSASSDPDSDALIYGWTQIAGPAVTLVDASTATPSFAAPFVDPGGADIELELMVDDGYGGLATDTVVIHLQNANDPPLTSAAEPTIGLLWPPSHGLVAVGIRGVSDPDDNATITIDAVRQDEPTTGTGGGDTAIDAVIQPDGTVLLRAERDGGGDGRVYHVHFTASDAEGSASGVVTVSVPKTKKSVAVDGGQLHDSTY